MCITDSTLITGEDIIATHFSSQARTACTLRATSFCGITYVIELPARLEPESPMGTQRYGTVTVGTMAADGFIGRSVRQGHVWFDPRGNDLLVYDEESGYMLMRATWITAVGYPT